jgi:hypothetical protein
MGVLVSHLDRGWFYSRLFIQGRDKGWGVMYCRNRCNSNFRFRNNFKIVLPCDLLVDNNTFSEMCVFKGLTGYTEDGGYVNRNARILIIIIIIIIISKAMSGVRS